MSATGGGQDRFEEFYQRHLDELARLAWLVLGDAGEADDVTADALTAAWRHWDRVSGADRPLAYVRRMVVNIAITRIRTQARDQRRLLALAPWAAVDHVVDTDTSADQDLRVALLALAPGRRACLVLRYAFDLPERDVADLLQITVGTVKSQTSKAAAQLRRSLGRVDTEPGDAEPGLPLERLPASLAPVVGARSGRLGSRPGAAS